MGPTGESEQSPNPNIKGPAAFLQYHEPPIGQQLVIILFFFSLALAEWISTKLFRAGLVGQIIIGMVFGYPVTNILEVIWQKTFIALGYIGLLLIIFGGALGVRLDLIKKTLGLSALAATVGVVTPIGLSFLVLQLGLGYKTIETFIIGAALSVTSLGTIFVAISKAGGEHNYLETKVGTTLLSAAVFDDISGLVMASVIGKLGAIEHGTTSLGWLIGRPMIASSALAIGTPVLARWAIAPAFRRWVEPHFAKFKHTSNIILMVAILCGFMAMSGYGGTSDLFGSFCAGAFVAYLPSKHATAPFVVNSREEGENEEGKTPNFTHTYEKYFEDVVHYLMEPLFFASIGFAIPFKNLWKGKALGQGFIYTICMLVAKAIVGLVIPCWAVITRDKSTSIRQAITESLLPAALLGAAMIPRGEIGLLVIQIGINETPYLSEEAFITAVWAILLNTMIGPMMVGLLIKVKGEDILKGPWGLDRPPKLEEDEVSTLHHAKSFAGTSPDEDGKDNDRNFQSLDLGSRDNSMDISMETFDKPVVRRIERVPVGRSFLNP